MPFHAAEQRNKVRKNDSAERSDFPKRPHFVSSTGKFAPGGPSERLHFLRRFAAGSFLCTLKGINASKEMNIKKRL